MIRRVTSFLRLPPLLAGALAALLPFSMVPAQAEIQVAPPAPTPAASFDPSDVYFQGYLATRDAEKLEAAGDLVGAHEKLERARKMFDSVRLYYPTWKPDMVKGRQEKTGESIAKIQPKADEIRLKKQKAIGELEGGEQISGHIVDPNKGAKPLANINPPAPLPVRPPDTLDNNRLNRAEAQVRALEQKLQEANRADPVGSSRTQSQLRDKDAQIDALQSQLQKAQTDLMAMRARLAAPAVESEVTDLNKKIESLDQEREAMARALSQSRSKITDVEAKAKILEADLALARQKEANLQRDLEVQRRAANDTVSGLLAQKKDLEATLKKKDAELAEAFKSIASLNKQLQESDATNKQLTEERNTLLSERNQMANLLKLNETGRIQELIEQNVGLAKDLRDAKERVERLDAEGKKSQDEYVDALNDLVIAKTRINKLQGEKAAQDKTIKELEERLRSEDSQLAGGSADPAEVTMLRDVIKKQLMMQKRRRDARDELVEAAKQLGKNNDIVDKAIELLDGNEISLTPEEQQIVAASETRVDGEFVNPFRKEARVAQRNKDELTRELEGYDNAAKRAFEQGRLLPARELYELSVEANPGDAGSLNKLGFILRSLEDWPGAAETFRRATELDAKNPYAHRMLGFSQLNLGDLQGAEQSLRRSIELAPDGASSHLVLGSVLFKQSRIPESESEFKSAISADPTLPEPYYNLAFLCAREGRKAEAQNYYRGSLERNGLPDYALEKKIGL